MANIRRSKVIAIMSAQTDIGGRIVEILMRGRNRLALGVPPSAFQSLDERLDGREGAYGQPVDLDQPDSTGTFFQIAFAQLGAPDAIVLEAAPANRRRLTDEKAIELGTRRLLHCLGAALPYVGSDLHFICITPPYGLAAIPVATAFLAAKGASNGAWVSPRVRMSVVSPSTAVPTDDVSFARTIVHLIREPQSPDVTETLLVSRKPRLTQEKRRPLLGEVLKRGPANRTVNSGLP